jgi:hypothetical protein
MKNIDCRLDTACIKLRDVSVIIVNNVYAIPYPPRPIPRSHCYLLLTILTGKIISIENMKYPPFQDQNKI